MRQAFHGMRKRWRSCLGLILGLVALFVCWLVVGVSFNFSGQSPQQKVEAARDVWDRHGINDYTMTVTFGSFSYVGRFYFTIQANQIVHIDTVENAFRQDQTPTVAQDDDLASYAKRFGSYGGFPASLNDYTMDNLFDFAAQQLASEPTMPLIAWCGLSDVNDPSRWRTEATFSTELGYIQSFSHTDCGHWDLGGGLLCPAISDCYAGFRILDFKPLK